MAGPLSFRALYALLAAVSLLSALCSADAVADLAAKGRDNVDAAIFNSTTCTKDKLRVRRDWGDMSDSEKRAYIAAVQCITKRPSKLSPEEYPGAKTRFDDFVVIHMKNTLTVHNTGNFLSWHRYYTFAYENALREECGYNGTQPYWNWGRWPEPENSPLFDGSDTSMGGQGEKVHHNGSGLRPPGTGGGCISKGPFMDLKINLGPLAAQRDTNPPPNPRADGYGYNPRCIKRDISGFLIQRDATTEKIAALITNSSSIGQFQNTMQQRQGIHAAGHFTVSGDPGSDFYTSSGDPYFYLNHAMVDRVWWIWQAQDFKNRQQVIAGGTAMFGISTRNQTLEDDIDLEIVNVDGKVHKIKELVSTVAGPFCYVYE